jgi:DNA-binding IclR family transcriptional regulator
MAEAAAPRQEGVAAVERALAILGAFREGEAALSLAELAARTGLYKSTILRLLASLERGRCVERQADARWALGPMLFRWGSLYAHASPVERHLPGALQALARISGETASFWVRHGGERLCRARVRGASPIRDELNEGDLLALPLGAGGRVLSAADPRALGTVATFGERNPETAAVAAAVFGPGGTLAGALGISGPRARVEARQDAHRAAVARAAEDLTRRLGGDLQDARG